MIRRPPRSTLFPTRRSSDLHHGVAGVDADVDIGPGALEGLQARDQPHGGKAGPGGDGHALAAHGLADLAHRDRKSTRLNSSHSQISYAVFCLKKKKK